MNVRSLISDSIPPVKPSDSLGTVLEWMGEFKVNQLPIVDGRKFAGIITEEDLLDAYEEGTVDELRRVRRDTAYIYEEQHLYQALRVMSAGQLEVLPVLDNDQNYVGLITLPDIVEGLGTMFALREPGSVLVLEVPERGYSLSEIGRIVESEDAKVLSLYVRQDEVSQAVFVTLKINVEDPIRVIAAFERHTYQIDQVYRPLTDTTNYRRNAQALLRMLQI